MRRREAPFLAHSRLRWYRDETWLYRFTARRLIPAALRLCADVSLEGLEHVPTSGPVILAANHRDNLDGYLLLHLVPRTVHAAARPNAFGTGALCAFWRRLCAFPADAWGMRHALSLLADGGVVAVFPQAMIWPSCARPAARSACSLCARGRRSCRWQSTAPNRCVCSAGRWCIELAFRSASANPGRSNATGRRRRTASKWRRRFCARSKRCWTLKARRPSATRACPDEQEQPDARSAARRRGSLARRYMSYLCPGARRGPGVLHKEPVLNPSDYERVGTPAIQLFKRHPWHGVSLGPDAPDLITCYIEIVPTDTVKYELDKLTGHLKIDRPQKYSSVCPTLYGLLPQHVLRRARGRSCAPADWSQRHRRRRRPDGRVRALRAADQPRRHSAARDSGGRVADDRPQPGRRQDHRRAQGRPGLRRLDRYLPVPAVVDRPIAPLLPDLQGSAG